MNDLDSSSSAENFEFKSKQSDRQWDKVPFSRIQTQRHRYAYVADGYLYISNKIVGNRIYLVCQQSRDCACRATAALIDGESFIRLSVKDKRQHNHAKPDLQDIQFRAAVINAARENATTPLFELYKDVRANVVATGSTDNEQEAIAAGLTEFRLLETTMHRSRRENEPKAPITRQELDFRKYQLTDANQENILLFDTGPADPRRFVVFGSQFALSHLADSDNWYCDGIVQSCPKTFAQVLIIHAFVNGQQFPLIYALLPDKTEQTYCRILNAVLGGMHQFNLVVRIRLMLSDCEVNFKAAVRTVFGSQLPHMSCYSHFCQEIGFELKDRGLLGGKYCDLPEVEIVYKMFMTLGLVPSDKKQIYFQELLSLCQRKGYVEAVSFAVDYFYPRWMMAIDHRYWTWYYMDIRVNSNVEAWNSTFNELVNKPQLNFNKFMSRLSKQHNWAITAIAARTVGSHQMRPIGNAGFIESNQRLRSIMNNIHLMNKIDYLRSLAVFSPELLT